MSKKLNDIVKFEIKGSKTDNIKNTILRLSKMFFVEKYATILECSKNVRKELKKAKTEHFHGVVYLTKKSGKQEIVSKF